jgi:thymidylate synthase (FAD)
MYAEMIERLIDKQSLEPAGLLHGEKRRDLRKKVQQAARAVLPNETETFLGMTGNVRAWRTFFELRATEHAETEIRKLAVECYQVLSQVWPDLLSDYRFVKLSDGTIGLETDYTKV